MEKYLIKSVETKLVRNYLKGIKIGMMLQHIPPLKKAKRQSKKDIDIDVSPSRRPIILKKIKEERKKNFLPSIDEITKENCGCTMIATYGSETTKSAIATACRGYRSEDYPNGIDVDEALYLSSLVPSERGFLWPIDDVVNGNEDKERKPVIPFIKEIEKYPGLLEIIKGIEGIYSRKGSHASGVIMFDENPYEWAAFMKTPSGEVITQYDLHMCEAAGGTKLDILVTEIQDKIIQTIKLLQNDNIIEKNLTLREAYDKYLHPNVLPIETDIKTWETIQKAASLDLFQLDSDIGRQGAKKVKPDNMIELSSVNGLIRLMTQEKGQETWLDKYIRFKNNPKDKKETIDSYNLSDSEKNALKKYIGNTNWIGISQEQMMRVLMDKDICGFSLKDANAARKVVSKKQMSKIPQFKEQVYTTAKTENCANFVWDYVVSPGLGYSFSDIHSISYSFIGFQSAYLATHWNPIYWNTACLIVNSGSLENENEEENNEKGTDYTKIAKAIGNITSKGIKISLVDINQSDFSFKPDVKNNKILYGLKGLSNVGDDVVDDIIKNRPYNSPKDFFEKVHPNRQAMISLIKGGAFDNMMDRKKCMAWYLWETCDKKKRLTLQNISGLIKYELLPEDTNERIMARRIYEFNRYLKATYKVNNNNNSNYYLLDNRGLKFLEELDYNTLIEENDGYCISIKSWEKIYQKWMDVFRDWIAADKENILINLNDKIFIEDWKKYAKGNLSSWEMESLCFYYHDHELKNLNTGKYGLFNFFSMPTEPIVDKVFEKGDKKINIFKLYKIFGTCIAKNKTKGSFSLLTPTGVVNVKMPKELFSMYDKQISQRNPDGSKTVLEKSWFNRGSMVIVQGIRSGDEFLAKNYKSLGSHHIFKIDKIYSNGDIDIRTERYKGEEEDEI